MSHEVTVKDGMDDVIVDPTTSLNLAVEWSVVEDYLEFIAADRQGHRSVDLDIVVVNAFDIERRPAPQLCPAVEQRHAEHGGRKLLHLPRKTPQTVPQPGR